MNSINIVLYQPEIPQNTGNIARTCAVTGAALHLIRPLGFEVTDARLKRAGLDYWHSLEIYYYDNMDDFMQQHGDSAYWCFSSKAPHCYTDVAYETPVFLIFGKETTGLPEDFLAERMDRCVRIPMREGQRCLNLSNSAAIGVYEVLRQHNFDGLLGESRFFDGYLY